MKRQVNPEPDTLVVYRSNFRARVTLFIELFVTPQTDMHQCKPCTTQPRTSVVKEGNHYVPNKYMHQHCENMTNFYIPFSLRGVLFRNVKIINI